MTSNPSQNMFELLIGENILSIGDRKLNSYLISGVEGVGYSWESNMPLLISVRLTWTLFLIVAKYQRDWRLKFCNL